MLRPLWYREAQRQTKVGSFSGTPQSGYRLNCVNSLFGHSLATICLPLNDSFSAVLVNCENLPSDVFAPSVSPRCRHITSIFTPQWVDRSWESQRKSQGTLVA